MRDTIKFFKMIIISKIVWPRLGLRLDEFLEVGPVSRFDCNFYNYALFS